MPWLSGPPGYPPGTQVRAIAPEGRGTSGILAVGEAGGEHEANDGFPFRPYAEAGSVLERALYRAGVPRDSLTLTNLVPYRPPRNWLDGSPWERAAIEFGRVSLDKLVRERKPKVILALGAVAMRELTGLAGAKCGIGLTRGFVVPGTQYSGIPVVGTFHPSHLRRGSKERAATGAQGKIEAAGGGTAGGMALLGVLIRDILLAQRVARDGPSRFVPCEHILDAPLDAWRAEMTRIVVLGRQGQPVYYDFETEDSLVADDESELMATRRDVTQVQIRVAGKALVSRWTPELLPILRGIFESGVACVDWNGRKFDREVLRDMGIRSDLGRFEDCMDMWHHAQPDLPRGLQFAASFHVPEVGPWKHMSASDPFWYGLLDVDILARIHEGLSESLLRVAHSITNVTLLEGYEGQVARLSPVLDRMSARGIPVDEARRQALDEEFTATLERLEQEMQSLYPEALKPVHPKNGFVRDPKVTDGHKRIEVLAIVKCECEWSKNVKGKAKILAERALADCDLCGNTGKITQRVVRWAKVLPFLPGSPQQVLRYIEWNRMQDVGERKLAYLARHPAQAVLAQAYAEGKTSWVVPKDYKTQNPTTAEPELRRLAYKTGDSLLPKILDFREIAKAKGTYVEGWKPGPDGAVHPVFGYKPATAQTSSQGPNAQNFYAHGDLAARMKAMIAARPGKVLISFDYKSFHVLTIGFEAKDPRYMRMARLDMHSFFALCGLIRAEDADRVEAMNDQELMGKLAWYRASPKLYSEFGGKTFGEIRDQQAKRAILGIGFGEGARTLWTLNPESFASIAEAQMVLDRLNWIFDKPEAWRSEITKQADKDHRLVTRFGHVRHFWDVFSRRRVAANYQPRRGEQVYENGGGDRWLLTHGDDYEAAIAYLPANDAFGMIRKRMVEIGESRLDERFGLNNTIHDSLVLECPSARADECLVTIGGILERPEPLLSDSEVAPDGLWCAVEAKLGPDLSRMEKIDWRRTAAPRVPTGSHGDQGLTVPGLQG